MIKSGCGRIGFFVGCALVFSLAAAGCVKREPRVPNPDQDRKAGTKDEKCGLVCRIQQRNESSKDPLRESDLTPTYERKEKPERSKKGLLDRLGRKNRKDNGVPSSETNLSTGVFHIVKKGETLWRICYTYKVDVDLVCRLNNITDPGNISPGQRLWIPGAVAILDVPVTTASNSNELSSDNDLGVKHPTPAIKQPDLSEKGSLLYPVPEGNVSSRFGASRSGHLHEGADLVAPMGSDILAADDGKVVYADNKIRGYGNMIIVKHAGDLVTVYAHNSKNLVRVGDLVKRGEKIAEVGQTGNASCPHCHFEVRLGEKPVDPEWYLP